MENIQVHKSIDHLFRQESGKMIAVLVHIFGSQHLELAEDVVQNTLLKAMEVWKYKGIPPNPEAWLHRVAKNNVIDVLRREKRKESIDFTEPNHQLLGSEYSLHYAVDHFWEENKIKDDFLAMMFAACKPGISPEMQVTFILKILCGFSTKEIAKAFITSESIISKRLYRTKEYFRQNKVRPIFEEENLEERLQVVLSVIYLIFNEGYHSSNSNQFIQYQLIEQALFLGKSLLDRPKTQLPEIYALMALMCFHASRAESRMDEKGNIILLEDQDRSKWDQELIAIGTKYLQHAALGNTISNYHYEAFIALEHCKAKSLKETNWKAIYQYYEQILHASFDPIVYLNQCLVLLEWKGSKEALMALKRVGQNKTLNRYYLYHSALSEIYSRMNQKKKAIEYLSQSLELAPSKSEKRLLKEKLAQLNAS